MTQIKQAFVMAAGLGKRLGKLTQDTPKPLIDIGGDMPLIRTLRLLENHGVEKVVMNIHYLPEKIKQVIDGADLSVKITYSEETELLETGGGVFNALNMLDDEPFFLVGSDLVWSEERVSIFTRLQENYTSEMEALLALIPYEKTTNFRSVSGDYFQNADNRLRYRGEDEHAPFVYGGVSIITKSMFANASKQHFPMLEMFNDAQKREKLFGTLYTGDWVDMGTPAGLEIAKNLVSEAEERKLA